MIPKIIWQTYESNYSELLPKALECSNSWKNLNPEWEYRYVSGKEREIFVLKYFGQEWLTIYNSYEINVLRSTLWRYMCLYVNGGLYSDLDMLCKNKIESWLDTELDFAVSKAPGSPGLTQSIFASKKESIFLKNILKDIKNIYYLNKENKKVYENVVDYSIYQTGYITFTKSIFNTVLRNKEIDNFMIYTGNMSKQIHNDFIEHYEAGNGNIFESNYIAWKTQKLENKK